MRGGGRAADGQRIVKGADYASDEEEPLRNEVLRRQPLQACSCTQQHSYEHRHSWGSSPSTRTSDLNKGSFVDLPQTAVS